MIEISFPAVKSRPVEERAPFGFFSCRTIQPPKTDHFRGVSLSELPCRFRIEMRAVVSLLIAGESDAGIWNRCRNDFKQCVDFSSSLDLTCHDRQIGIAEIFSQCFDKSVKFFQIIEIAGISLSLMPDDSSKRAVFLSGFCAFDGFPIKFFAGS